MLTDHHYSEETHLWPVLRGTSADTAAVAQLSGAALVTTATD